MRKLIIIETEDYGCYVGYKEENLPIEKINKYINEEGLVSFKQINGQTTIICEDEIIIDILEDKFYDR